jgi:exodeoxyribonuclease VII large subunit
MLPLSLSDLSDKIRNAIADVFPFAVPVVAEISEMNINRNGHCYIEFIEQHKGQIIAKVRGIIYANRFPLLQSYFTSVTGAHIQVGLKVLVMVRLSYHDLYGLSVEINDIDPKYTLGDLEQQKQLVIERLVNQGVIDMNKSLPLPKRIKNIAVISSATAAGYGDFINHLEKNPHGFSFNIDLFEAFMQGAQTVDSIHAAVDRVFNSETEYDIVVIIRGGGSKAELAVFDNFDLAYLITQLPIPVFTGIGHERDTSVADFVANQGLKTPTAVADFIVNINMEAKTELEEMQSRLEELVLSVFGAERLKLGEFEHSVRNFALRFSSTNTEKLIRYEKLLALAARNFSHKKQNSLHSLRSRLDRATHICFSKQESKLDMAKQKLSVSFTSSIKSQQQRLSLHEQRVTLSDPQEILNRGYALVSMDGNIIIDSQQLKEGNNVRIHLSKGKFGAQVTNIE